MSILREQSDDSARMRQARAVTLGFRVEGFKAHSAAEVRRPRNGRARC